MPKLAKSTMIGTKRLLLLLRDVPRSRFGLLKRVITQLSLARVSKAPPGALFHSGIPG